MARSNKPGPPPPEASFVILDADGLPVTDAASMPTRSASRPGLNRRLRLGATLAAAVAVFALGVVAGRNTIVLQSGGPTIAPYTAGSAPVATSSTSSGSTATSAPQSSQPASKDAGSPEGSADAVSKTPADSRFAEVTGPCGAKTYIAQVGYVSPLPEPIDVTILAGSPPRRYDLSNGTVSPPLINLEDHQSVFEMAADEHGTVVATRACTDPMSLRVFRITKNRVSTPIKPPAGWRIVGGLIRSDAQIWAGLVRGNSGSVDRLLATDGSGKVRSMPNDADWVDGSETVSPDGSRTASVVLNTDGTPGYHLEVTDTTTGKTTVVPGINLGAASASVAFSADSQWMVVAVYTLAGGRLLVYGPGTLDGPYSISGTVQGPQTPIAVSSR